MVETLQISVTLVIYVFSDCGQKCLSGSSREKNLLEFIVNLFAAQCFGVLAQSAGGQQGAGGGMMGTLLMMVPIFAIMYFLMIRPQQKKQKEHEQMLTQIKAGDKVMTNGGILATVVKVADKRVTLEVADRVHVDFVLGAIANIIKDEASEAADTGKK